MRTLHAPYFMMVFSFLQAVGDTSNDALNAVVKLLLL